MNIMIVCQEQINAALSVTLFQFIQKTDDVTAQGIVTVNGLEILS